MKDKILRQLKSDIVEKEKELEDLRKGYEALKLLPDNVVNMFAAMTTTKYEKEAIPANKPIESKPTNDENHWKRKLVESVIAKNPRITKEEIREQLRAIGKYEDVIAPAAMD